MLEPPSSRHHFYSHNSATNCPHPIITAFPHPHPVRRNIPPLTPPHKHKRLHHPSAPIPSSQSLLPNNLTKTPHLPLCRTPPAYQLQHERGKPKAIALPHQKVGKHTIRRPCVSDATYELGNPARSRSRALQSGRRYPRPCMGWGTGGIECQVSRSRVREGAEVPYIARGRVASCLLMCVEHECGTMFCLGSNCVSCN
jgi:hypothetical protein